MIKTYQSHVSPCAWPTRFGRRTFSSKLSKWASSEANSKRKNCYFIFYIQIKIGTYLYFTSSFLRHVAVIVWCFLLIFFRQPLFSWKCLLYFICLFYSHTSFCNFQEKRHSKETIDAATEPESCVGCDRENPGCSCSCCIPSDCGKGAIPTWAVTWMEVKIKFRPQSHHFFQIHETNDHDWWCTQVCSSMYERKACCDVLWY